MVRSGSFPAAVVLACAMAGAFPGVAAAVCGDGVLDGAEQCDPGLDVADDCCNPSCGHEEGGAVCGASGSCDAGVCVTLFTPSFIRLRGPSPGRTNGSIVVRGTFATAPPLDTLDASAGVGITVRDAAAVEAIVAWAPDHCRTFVRGGILCLRPDAARKLRANPIPGTSTWRVTVRMKGVAIETPFAAPVRVRISTDGRFDRAGEIAACTSAVANGALSCRAPHRRLRSRPLA